MKKNTEGQQGVGHAGVGKESWIFDLLALHGLDPALVALVGETAREHQGSPLEVLGEALRALFPRRKHLLVQMAALLGESGSGKSTALAKLATHYAATRGRHVGIIDASDGDHSILEHHAVRNSLRLVRVAPHEDGAAIVRARAALAECDCVLIDTPAADTEWWTLTGRFQVLAEAQVERVIVLPATADTTELISAIEGLPKDRACPVFASQIDRCASFGGFVSTMARREMSLWFLGEGTDCENGIEEVSPLALAARLLQPIH